MTEKVLVSWSGGKDCVLVVNELLKTNHYQIMALLTTITKDYDRISMHGVRRVLLEQQASSLGIPLEKVFISKNISMEEYDTKMEKILLKYLKNGVSSVVFGDIFLDDVRKYRDENLSKIGLNGIFPLWKRDTDELARNFIDLGFKAIITCVDSNILEKSFVGRAYSAQFLNELPSNVDPCGENGEFHSFVYEGPIFKEKILYALGNIVLRNKRFYYCDLIPV